MCPCRSSTASTALTDTKCAVGGDHWPLMETFGCSFFVHSGWVRGSNEDGVGVVGTAEFCVKTAGRRRSRKRPAIDEGAESCEDAVMVMTSPLAVKLGLRDTAGEEKKLLQHLNATFLHLASKKRSSLWVTSKSFFFLADFLFLRVFLNEAQENRKRLKKTVQRKNILIERTSLWAEKKKNQTNRGWLERWARKLSEMQEINE